MPHLRYGKVNDKKIKTVCLDLRLNFTHLLLSGVLCAFASPDHQEAAGQQAQREPPNEKDREKERDGERDPLTS